MYRRTIYLLASLLTLCLCTGVTVADLQEGLVSHWKLDEGAGSIAHDRAGTSDGQLYGSANWMDISHLSQLKEPATKYVLLEENDPRGYNINAWVINPGGIGSMVWSDPR